MPLDELFVTNSFATSDASGAGAASSNISSDTGRMEESALSGAIVVALDGRDCGTLTVSRANSCKEARGADLTYRKNAEDVHLPNSWILQRSAPEALAV